MAIRAHFEHPTMTIEQYEESMRRLAEAGLASPPGRMAHIAFEHEDLLEIMSVWDSQKSLDAFIERVHPIARESGIADPVLPSVSKIINFVVA